MDHAKDNERTANPADWDTSEDYYRAEEGMEELKLEDFMEEDSDSPFRLNGDLQVNKTAEDVRQVMKLSGEGKTIKEIADGDPISIAHMVLIGQ